MFLNSPVKVFNAISDSSLTSVNNELYENGIRIATQTDIDFLQNEIDNIPSAVNCLVTDTPQIIPEQGCLFVSDGLTSTGTNASNGLKVTDIINADLPLVCNNTANFNSGVNIQSFSSLPTAMYMDSNNDLNINNTQQSKTIFTNSSEYNFDNVVKINELECSLTATFNNGLLIQNVSDPVSIYMDENKNFNINNSQPASKTIFSNSSSYEFDNSIILKKGSLLLQNSNAVDALPVGLFVSNNKNFYFDNQNGTTSFFSNSSSYNFDTNLKINNGGQLLLYNNFDEDAISLRKDDKLNGDFVLGNKTGSKDRFQGASEYNFDNNITIGDDSPTDYTLYINGVDINSQINTNTSDISTLQGQVSTNTTNIATNTTNIATNTTNIATNTTDISTINGKLKQNLSNYYVSTSGNNSTGDGTVYNPWATIGKAVTVLNALAGDITAVINVAAGNYAEASIVVTKSGISIIGANAISTVFTGNITFTMGANSSFYSIGNLSNISVVGTVFFNNPHNFSNSFTISGIISAPPNGKPCLTLSNSGAGNGGDVTVNNSSVFYANADTVPITINQNASLFMVGCQIQNNPSPLITNTIQSYIRVLDAGRCNLFACSLYNASTNASVGALITINNSSAVSTSTTINNCILMFTNGVATTSGAIVNFTNSANIGTVNFYNNFCKCFLTQNAPNNYIILKSGAGTVTLAQGGNLASGNHTIPPTAGAFTKVDFSAVV